VDPDSQDQYPEKFKISGPELQLVGVFPMDIHVGYGEHFDKMLDRTVDIDASGNPSRRSEVSSFITLPGETQTAVTAGTLQVKKVIDRNILQGAISLELEGGRTLSGDFVFVGTTWG